MSSFFDKYRSVYENEWESHSKKIDRSGTVYHAFQRGIDRESIFSSDVGKYRHNLLCKLCSEHGVVVIFSVVMPNHTHDVLAADSLDKISKVLKTLNTKVSHYIRQKYPGKYDDKRKMFDSRPTYKPVTDRVYLFYLGKYLYDNPAYLVEAGRFVPYTCFWMFEKGYLIEPYRKELFIDLFGMAPKEMADMYRTMSKEEIWNFAMKNFNDWSKEKNDEIFKSHKN